jgi:outer membrane receptor for ferrienterochelin and colicins
MRLYFLLLQLFLAGTIFAQSASITGQITDDDGTPIPFASVGIPAAGVGTLAEEDGSFRLENLSASRVKLTVSALGFAPLTKSVDLSEEATVTVEIVLFATGATMDEIVVTGTMKAVSRTNSPVPVEVYTADFFRANPTPSVFESLQNVNGVRPQLNCAVCNTGDIHINGLEGPYTMVLIDGMTIVSGLSTVYGLTGIPQSLIARVEVVKGPASTLYGSEAVGGLINVITKDPGSAPVFSADVMASGWGELNTDLGFKATVGGKAHALVGVNYFRYQNRIDKNSDGFTDLTL